MMVASKATTGFTTLYVAGGPAEDGPGECGIPTPPLSSVTERSGTKLVGFQVDLYVASPL